MKGLALLVAYHRLEHPLGNLNIVVATSFLRCRCNATLIGREPESAGSSNGMILEGQSGREMCCWC